MILVSPVLNLPCVADSRCGSAPNRYLASQMLSIEITKAELENSREVHEVLNNCAAWLDRQGMKHWGDFYTDERVSDLIRNRNVLILRYNGEAIGTITYYFEDESWSDGLAAIFICALAVDPQHHKRGFGSLRLASVEEEAKKLGLTRVRFDSLKNYERLSTFYTRRGYEVVGETRRKHEYWLYEKLLKN